MESPVWMPMESKFLTEQISPLVRNPQIPFSHTTKANHEARGSFLQNRIRAAGPTVKVILPQPFAQHSLFTNLRVTISFIIFGH